MTLNLGDKAPDFSLYNTEKKIVSLSDYKGKNVLILFFPLAFTGVCTEELCSIRDELSVYNSLETEVLGISVDSYATLAQFKKEKAYNFILLSDFNKEVCRSYGAFYDEFALGMKGVAKRSAFLVDPEGYLQYIEVLENAGKVPNFDAIKTTLTK